MEKKKEEKKKKKNTEKNTNMINAPGECTGYKQNGRGEECDSCDPC
jgi:hypothetical protein